MNRFNYALSRCKIRKQMIFLIISNKNRIFNLVQILGKDHIIRITKKTSLLVRKVKDIIILDFFYLK